MKYCTHCGAEVNDEAVVCVKCGRAIENAEPTNKPKNETMKTLILVFLILGCITGAAACLIPLAWCIPITLSIKRKMDNGEPIGTALKVCTLLFVSLIAGILLLCLDEE